MKRGMRDIEMRFGRALLGSSLAILFATSALAQSGAATAAASLPAATTDAPADVLSPSEWKRVDAAVERALGWLAAQQQEDGSFSTIPKGQPGVSSLTMMAFVAHGHVPGEGPCGERLEQAIDFVVSCQKENGLVTVAGPDGPRISRNVEYEIGTCAAYNHAIGSLSLSEMYGMCSDARARRMQAVIDKALAASLAMQQWPKQRDVDRGGWRYIQETPGLDADLSITGWELMFLRSARNAGFNVPKQPIDDAVKYVRNSFNEKYGAFEYLADYGDHRSRAMAGAGILALAHAGFHGAPETQRTGEWALRHDFDEYNEFIVFNSGPQHDRYHYALLNCCQGMYQLGGRYWEEFFPRVVQTILANQQPDGSWPADSHWHDGQFGTAYTTALVVLTLGAPNQLLPIFQR